MDLNYYNQEVDRIVWDLFGNHAIPENDIIEAIDLVTETIYQYDQSVTKTTLKLLISFLVEQKYQKCYVYDLDSEFNRMAELPQCTLKAPSPRPDDPDMMLIGQEDLAIADKAEVQRDSTKPQYFNPELNTDKIQFTSAEDLVSHRHDYEGTKYLELIYLKRRNQVAALKQIPQHEQKSKQWLQQRNECLTATAVATVLDEDPYKYPIELFLDKCGHGKPFVETVHVHHGKMYEQIGNMFYSFRNNIDVGEYGLIQHGTHSFIGASPDGICDKFTKQKDKLSKLVGRLLEIKFPNTRKINTKGKLDGDIVPHYYYVQVQTQLFVTGMDECDFLQCKVEEYDSWNDFVDDSHPKIPGLSKKTNLESGCVVQLLPKNMVGGSDVDQCLYHGKYLYPPKLHMTHEEIKEWLAEQMISFPSNQLSEEYMIDKVVYWRLSMVTCNLIKTDQIWFESKIPILKQFWDYVLFYRKNSRKIDELISFLKKISSKNSAEIFAKIHKEYAHAYPKTTYQPLYQKETVWRKQYNGKHA